MANIATFVFLKVRTPPVGEGLPLIMELGMAAVARDTMKATAWKYAGRNNIHKDDIIHPTELNKLVLNRQLIPIPNDGAGYERNYFSVDMFNCIHGFLSVLKKPVCLIAQNGFSHDFYILKQYLKSVNCSLQEDLLCTDLLYASYDLRERYEFNMDDVEYSLDLATKRVTRDIFYGDDPKPEQPYRMRDVYTRVVKRELMVVNTDALYDCLRMMEIGVMLNKEFVKWVDYSHKRFVD